MEADTIYVAISEVSTLDIVEAVALVATLGTVIVYTVLTYSLNKNARRQADASEQQLDLLRKQTTFDEARFDRETKEKVEQFDPLFNISGRKAGTDVVSISLQNTGPRIKNLRAETSRGTVVKVVEPLVQLSSLQIWLLQIPIDEPGVNGQLRLRMTFDSAARESRQLNYLVEGGRIERI